MKIVAPSILRTFRQANLTAVMSAATVAAILLPSSPLTQVVAILGVIAVPGSILCKSMVESSESFLLRILIVAAGGLLVAFGVGVVLGSVPSIFGIPRPLQPIPVHLVWILLLFVIAAISLARDQDSLRISLSGARPSAWGWTVALMIPPIMALLGSRYLDNGSSASVAIVAGVLAICMALYAVVTSEGARRPSRIQLLLSSALTIIWQTPLRGGWLSGWDVQHENFVLATQLHQAAFPLTQLPNSFTDPYAGMLSLTVWPAQIHILTGLNARVILGLLPTVFLIGVLAATWIVVREWLPARMSALLCAVLVVGSGPLLREIPGVTRQCYGLFFLSLAVASLVLTKLPIKTARILLLMATVGVATSHYSSAFLWAGGVLFAYLCTRLFRAPRGRAVVNGWTASIVIGFVAFWESTVAHSGSSIQTIWHSIQKDGLRLLPSSGNIFSRWIKGASISQLVPARVIQSADITLRTSKYSWMTTDPRSLSYSLVNHPAPKVHGVHVIGGIFAIGGTLLNEVVVIGATLSVLACVLICRREKHLSAFVGLASFALFVSFVSRLSQTIGVAFGPSRVQATMYPIFAISLAIVVSEFMRNRRAGTVMRWASKFRGRSVRSALAAITVAIALAASTQLVSLTEGGSSIPMAYSNSGENAQRLINPEDLIAADWIARELPVGDLVQADTFGQLALYDNGFATRPNFIVSLDPIIIENRSWLFAYHTNVLFQRGRGGNLTRVGVFRFPTRYFSESRSVLYSSSTDAVYGSDPLAFLGLP